jgi:hypothetical protein
MRSDRDRTGLHGMLPMNVHTIELRVSEAAVAGRLIVQFRIAMVV